MAAPNFIGSFLNSTEAKHLNCSYNASRAAWSSTRQGNRKKPGVRRVSCLSCWYCAMPNVGGRTFNIRPYVSESKSDRLPGYIGISVGRLRTREGVGIRILIMVCVLASAYIRQCLYLKCASSASQYSHKSKSMQFRQWYRTPRIGSSWHLLHEIPRCTKPSWCDWS